MTEHPDPAIVRNWLDYAQRDLKAAYELQRAGGLSGIVAFHAQQAAEKALKALTLQYGGEQHKMHDIARLLDLCEEASGLDLSSLRPAEILTAYAVEARYPDPGFDVSTDAATNAVAMASMVVDWVRKHIKPSN